MEATKKESRKPTNAQLQRKIDNAYVFVPKDKDSQSIFFDDKGVRITVTLDYALVETGGHTHVFRQIVGSSISRPYIYLKRFVECALDNIASIEVKDDKGNVVGRSYAKLFEALKAKEDKAEYNVATFVDWWLFIIFNNLYSIDETMFGTWIVYFKYLCAIASNSIILDEHKEDLTNKMFLERFKVLLDEFTENVKEEVIIKALSDEERLKQELEAIEQTEQEQIMEAQASGEQTK